MSDIKHTTTKSWIINIYKIGLKTSQNFLLKYHTKLVMRHKVELAQNNTVVLNNDATMSNLPQATMS